ncbi:exonuclease subunit SbcD [Vibrio ulleungensis]|uniref:Nuclease SbcCD subunit D n=1 Tax=Vibrio ulleungensis TaxID=2807619 RepID=A0ABS2HC10_9VIBR|nr:exonuclease subunit SbcD [Vibrio ulleungensis]MBM7035133.1 exonuclease subunit SbcD [Vibrio ulleungensis]
MRLLHTSDWHLGQHFFTQSRLKEHQLFIDWLCDTVVSQSVDAIIVAGDVFDTGSPPSYARELYNQFVVRMHKLDCQVVILAGNHDSVAVLQESQQLLAYLNTSVITNASDDYDQQLVELRDNNGELGAVVCAVPFLRPRDVISQNQGISAQQRQLDLSQAISAHYLSLYQHAAERRDKHNPSAPIIGTGHLTTLGVSQSESVRDIYIGTLEGFASTEFPPFDYLALGHIHRPQRVSKNSNFRYSGSPIPLSFDEATTQKSVVIIDCNEQCQTTLHDIPVFRPLISLSGDLTEIESSINALEDSTLTTWLSISVSSVEQYSDLQAKIYAMLEPLNADVLRIQRQISSSTADSEVIEHSLDELLPLDVFERKLNQQLADDMTDVHKQRIERVTKQFNDILNQVETSQQDDPTSNIAADAPKQGTNK